MFKYWVKYTKGEKARFISHLDLLRAMDRAMRRAGIPIAYSQGFNPHPKLSFATPLSVGIVSYGDYLEMELTEELSTEEIINKMNQKLPVGIEILGIKKLDGKKPTLGAIVEAATYKVEINNELEQKIKETLDKKEIIIERTNKKGTKSVDIRPLIYKLYSKDNGLYMLLATSSSANVKPKEILNIFSIDNPNIDKQETYCGDENNGFITPLEWLEK